MSSNALGPENATLSLPPFLIDLDGRALGSDARGTASGFVRSQTSRRRQRAHDAAGTPPSPLLHRPASGRGVVLAQRDKPHGKLRPDHPRRIVADLPDYLQ